MPLQPPSPPPRCDVGGGRTLEQHWNTYLALEHKQTNVSLGVFLGLGRSRVLRGFRPTLPETVFDSRPRDLPSYKIDQNNPIRMRPLTVKAMRCTLPLTAG